MRAIDMLAAAAAPAALVALGLHFGAARPRARAALKGRIVAIALVKLAALPALVWLSLTYIVPATAANRDVAVFFTSMPTAIGAFVFASAYKVYTDEIAAALVLITAMSAALVPLYLAILAPI